MTGNQLVAYNLRRARELRGWTQDQAAEKLEPHLGVRWSKASFSAAEQSVKSNRTREFSADDLLAFAAAFELPVTWFFLPAENDGFPTISSGGKTELKIGDLLDAVFPYGGDEAVGLRLVDVLTRLPKGLRSKADEGARRWTMERMRAMVLTGFGEFGALARDMHKAAERLEQVYEIGLQDAAKELGAADASGRKEEAHA